MRMFSSIVGGGIGAVLGIAQLILFFVQLGAIAAGLEASFGLPWWLAGLLIYPVLLVPFLGAVLGFVGAIAAWGLLWWQATLIFFGPQLAIVILNVLATGADRALAAKRA